MQLTNEIQNNADIITKKDKKQKPDWGQSLKDRKVPNIVKELLSSLAVAEKLIETIKDGIALKQGQILAKVFSDICYGLKESNPAIIKMLQYKQGKEKKDDDPTLIDELMTRAINHDKKDILPAVIEVFHDDFAATTGLSTMEEIHELCRCFNKALYGKYWLGSRRIPPRPSVLPTSVVYESAPAQVPQAIIAFCLQIK